MFIMDSLCAARVALRAAVRCSFARERCPGSGACIIVVLSTALVSLYFVLAMRDRQTRNPSVLFSIRQRVEGYEIIRRFADDMVVDKLQTRFVW